MCNDRRQRVELARWIAYYFIDLGGEAPCIKGKGYIMKMVLNFAAKFWWMVVRYRLCPTTTDNFLIWDGLC